LGGRIGVTARRGGPGDVLVFQPGDIEMIGTDGCRANEAYRSIFQQA